MDFPLITSSLNPTTSGVGGGALITVLGSGFSVSTKVKIDGLECSLVSMNYSAVSCLSPQNVRLFN